MSTPNASRPHPSASQITLFGHTSGGLVPIDPTGVAPDGLNPYAERFELVAGVRQTADVPTADLELSDETWQLEPLPFVAASVEPGQRLMRYGWFPLATAILSAIAQTVLAATIAAGTVPPVVGIVAVVSTLLCSLCLIGAQCITQTGDSR